MLLRVDIMKNTDVTKWNHVRQENHDLIYSRESYRMSLLEIREMRELSRTGELARHDRIKLN